MRLILNKAVCQEMNVERRQVRQLCVVLCMSGFFQRLEKMKPIFPRIEELSSLALLPRPSPEKEGEGLSDELAVLLEDLAVDVDRAAVAQVLDHVPVQGGLVAAAGFRIGLAEGEVDAAADLFVEQDVLDELLDAVVGANAELAEPPRAVVHVEHRAQELLVLLGGRLDDLAFPEDEPDAVHFAAGVADGIGIFDMALGGILDRPGEDFAARHVVMAVRVDEHAALDGERQVGLRTDDPDPVRAAQFPDQSLLLFGERLPCRDRVLRVGECRRVDEVLKLGQTHLRVLRVRLGGEEGETPFLLHHFFAQRFRRARIERLLLRVDRRERAGVRAGVDVDRAVEVVRHRALDAV